MQRKRSKTVFTAQPRRAQKRALIHVKNTLRRFAPYFDGRFYTYDVLGSGTSWADIYFVSRKNPHLFYNATIDTAHYGAKEKAEAMAWDQAEHEYETQYPQHAGLFYDHAPGFNQKGHPDFVAFFKPTLYQWLDACAQRLLNEGKVAVHCGAQILPNYAYGVGLHMTVHASSLTPELITAAIDAFFAAGEVTYQDPNPVAIDPQRALSASSCNRIDSDPTDWGAPFAAALESQKQAQHLELALEPSTQDSPSNPVRL